MWSILEYFQNLQIPQGDNEVSVCEKIISEQLKRYGNRTYYGVFDSTVELESKMQKIIYSLSDAQCICSWPSCMNQPHFSRRFTSVNIFCESGCIHTFTYTHQGCWMDEFLSSMNRISDSSGLRYYKGIPDFMRNQPDLGV